MFSLRCVTKCRLCSNSSCLWDVPTSGSSGKGHTCPAHAPCSLEISALYQNLDVSWTKFTDTCFSPGLSAKWNFKTVTIEVSLHLLTSQELEVQSPTPGAKAMVGILGKVFSHRAGTTRLGAAASEHTPGHGQRPAPTPATGTDRQRGQRGSTHVGLILRHLKYLKIVLNEFI